MPDRFTFRLITAGDIPQLHRWRNLPHVSQWWDPQHPTLPQATAEYREYMRAQSSVSAFIIVHNGDDLGYIQKWPVRAFPDYKPYTELDDAEWGIDLFIGDPTRLHRGLGTAAARQFLRDQVFADETVPAAIIDPLPTNAVAIRSYEKVGFQHVATFTHDETGVYFMRLPRADFTP